MVTLAVTEPVLMEVLTGARSREERDSLRRLLRRCELVPVEPADYEAAAGLFRACRGHGETVRNMIDCLIAAVALRAGLALLQADADFDAIARTTPLRVASPRFDLPAGMVRRRVSVSESRSRIGLP